ncbi:hypothetical protein LZ012_11355 [Dechloromonas sp. XY25]|uniref:Uncharacterized protein n=1 Tax=Dechloromonas hankyongensis TaxID=2908002 RepID=A0ABS9K328_9RHOO|nr:hypothetical protein [Dechloromonas hankyongensis]MCG2577589.1 hypothetical protein [Dechloromonas hankyongensis]
MSVPPAFMDQLNSSPVSDQCVSLANDIAQAMQQIFDLGGWNAVLWLLVGFTLGGGPVRFIDWFVDWNTRRRAA